MFERSTSDARPARVDSRRCQAGAACRNADSTLTDPETGKPVRRGALCIDPPLCPACRTHLAAAVRYLPKDYTRLSAAIGDRTVSRKGGQVAASRDDAIPINTAVESLMVRLVTVIDMAAEVVESELQMTGAARRRSTMPGWAERGFAAVRGAAPSAGRVVETSARLVDAQLDVLLEAETQPVTVWGRIPDDNKEWDRYEHGQPRDVVELSGLDIALEIVKVNRLIGQMLGLSRLRHHYDLPCVNCQTLTVGRDDGASVIDCSTCGAKYSDGEYGFFVQLTADEIKTREEDDMLRYLLAEAYWRLDTLQRLATALQQIDVAAVVNDGPEKAAELIGLITAQLTLVLTSGAQPHTAPLDRQPPAPRKQGRKKQGAAHA